MAFSISCADAGSDCPANFTTESRAELMDHITVHAEKAHPDMEMTPEAAQQMSGLIKTV